MKTSQQSYVKNGDTIVGIQVTKFDNGIVDEKFTIPVIDVRRGEDARRMATHITKTTNSQRGSKFMKPSYSVMGKCYQNSFKS